MHHISLLRLVDMKGNKTTCNTCKRLCIVKGMHEGLQLGIRAVIPKAYSPRAVDDGRVVGWLHHVRSQSFAASPHMLTRGDCWIMMHQVDLVSCPSRAPRSELPEEWIGGHSSTILRVRPQEGGSSHAYCAKGTR